MEVEEEIIAPAGQTFSDEFVNGLTVAGSIRFHDAGSPSGKYPVRCNDDVPGDRDEWFGFWAPKEKVNSNTTIRLLMCRTFDLPASCEAISQIVNSAGTAAFDLQLT
jgi:hypothetical protein